MPDESDSSNLRPTMRCFLSMPPVLYLRLSKSICFFQLCLLTIVAVYGNIDISSRLFPTVRKIYFPESILKRWRFASFSTGRYVFLHNDKPPNLYRRGGDTMITWIEILALLTLIVAIIQLVVNIYNGNKKN